MRHMAAVAGSLAKERRRRGDDALLLEQARDELRKVSIGASAW